MNLRQATIDEVPKIWEILQQAIERRRLDGSQQWQNGYPNVQSIHQDLDLGHAYVLTESDEILAYAAIIFDKEPAYEVLDTWLTKGDYVVIHRVATSDRAKGKGLATRLFELIENLAISEGVFSIKVDTNFDNAPMLRIMDKLGYTYCGEVYFHGSARKAFEKVLHKV